MSKKFEQTVLEKFDEVFFELGKIHETLGEFSDFRQEVRVRFDSVDDTLNLFRKELNETKDHLEEKIDTLSGKMEVRFDETYEMIKAVGIKAYDDLQPRIKALETARS